MNKDRLMRLVSLLRNNADNPNGAKFDINNWVSPSVEVQRAPDRDPIKVTADIPINCGTTACAFGLAALSPEFQAEGLTLVIDRDGTISPQYQDKTGSMEAAAAFFEIPEDAAWCFFSPDYYPSSSWYGAVGERAVANRIEKYVNDDIVPDPVELRDQALAEDDDDDYGDDPLGE